MQDYTVWIEPEAWAPGEWNPPDDNTDVIVTFADGTAWVATFFTYANIASLVETYKRTGECLHGRYFWASDMILVDEVSRQRIEEVVAHLIDTGGFEHAFKEATDEVTDH